MKSMRSLKLHQPQTLLLIPTWASPPCKLQYQALPFLSALSGLSLNGLTIFSFCKTPDLRTPSNLLVLSLALADSGISLNALVAAVSSLFRYQPHPLPQALGSCSELHLGIMGKQTRTFLSTYRKLSQGQRLGQLN